MSKKSILSNRLQNNLQYLILGSNQTQFFSITKRYWKAQTITKTRSSIKWFPASTFNNFLIRSMTTPVKTSLFLFGAALFSDLRAVPPLKQEHRLSQQWCERAPHQIFPYVAGVSFSAAAGHEWLQPTLAFSFSKKKEKTQTKQVNLRVVVIVKH